MFSLIQIIIVVFMIFAAASAVRRYLKKELRHGPMILWLLLWLAIAVAVLAPQTTELMARLLGVGRGVDVVVYLAVVVLLFLQYRTWVRLEKMDRAITAAVRAAALRDLDREQNKPGSNSRE